ncbi:hypothetical protein PMI17_01776 [Pantoea sp. GM01]|nr:hypothetical protein PMI17_01776 [Pantoea sp. GM01]
MIKVLKVCYGCGGPVLYAGFGSIPKIPMCAICRSSSMKPRYVYLNGFDCALPKYDINSPMILDRLRRGIPVVLPVDLIIKFGGADA